MMAWKRIEGKIKTVYIQKSWHWQKEQAYYVNNTPIVDTMKYIHGLHFVLFRCSFCNGQTPPYPSALLHCPCQWRNPEYDIINLI